MNEKAKAENGGKSEAPKKGKSAEPEMLKKLVARQICGGKFDFKRGDPARKIYTVYGIAEGIKTGDGQYGPWTQFLGSFEAIREGDGARFASNKLFLQEPAQSLLVNALSAAQKSDPQATVQFAFEVGLKTAEREGGSAYEYTVRPVIRAKENDALADLRGQVSGLLAGPQAA